MTPQPDTTQAAIAAACIFDAALSAIDPSGHALRQTKSALRDGLLLAAEMGVSHNRGAAEIIKQVLANLEGMNVHD